MSWALYRDMLTESFCLIVAEVLECVLRHPVSMAARIAACIIIRRMMLHVTFGNVTILRRGVETRAILCREIPVGVDNGFGITFL